MITTQPLLGVGLGNYLPTLSELQTSVSPIPYIQPVHNIFLLVTAETGLVGLSFAIWFICLTYKRLIEHWRFHPPFYVGLLVSLSAFMVIGLFDHYLLTLQQGQLFFACLLGFCWSSVSLHHESFIHEQ